MGQYGGVRGDPYAANRTDMPIDDVGLDRGRPAAGEGLPRSAMTGRELLVVDPEVPGTPILVNGRRPGVDVLHLAAGGRGLEQLADQLAGCRGIVGLHVLCPGEPGALILAGDRIDLPALAMRPAALAGIADALDPAALVVLYGSWVAAGAAGLRFLDYLESALGTGVAASAGPVGAAMLGGRWVLRDRNGAAAETAFSPLARATYPALLGAGQ